MVDIIFPRRRMSVMAATADDIEKKTRGMMAVKSRLRKISPNGLKTEAFPLKIIPSKEPISREIININEKPYDFKKAGISVFILFTQ